MASSECIAAVKEAAKGILTDDELISVFERAQKIKDRIRAQGNLDGFEDQVIAEVNREADLTRIAAATQRRHVALNAIVRDRFDNHMDTLISEGLSPRNAILSFMEGSQRSVSMGRVSVYGQRQGFETKYIGGMVAALERDAPHIKKLVNDKEFSNAVVREMAEIKKDGNPGVSNNPDAVKVANIFSEYAEVSRQGLNKYGASVGKLDGWGGPHRHDNSKISKVTEEDWVGAILPKLDLDRSFPDVKDQAELEKILGGIYREIITGQPDRLTAQSTGKITGPANLAKSLQKSRVLHFKDADAWITYNDQFGDGTIINGMISHQQRAAAHAAQMSTLGPNPEIMLTAKLDGMRRQIKNSDLSAKEKAKQIEQLQLGKGGAGGTAVSNAFLEMQGLTMSPINFNGAQLSQGIRNYANVTSLGGAVLTAVPTDAVTAGLAAQFRGGGFFRGFTSTMGELLSGRSVAERNEVAYLLGESFDGVISGISSSHYVHDGIPGAGAKLTDSFFKWTGLTGWTDKLRGAASRVVSAEMGMRRNTAFSKLSTQYSNLLDRHGIGKAEWDAIRSVEMRLVNDNTYITPDLMQTVGDAQLEPLIAGQMADISAVTSDPKRLDRARSRLQQEARDNLELQTSRLFADEVSFAVVETDAASRRIALQGTRPGTVVGEVMRFVMQFKGFPIAFSQRVLGRAAHAFSGPDKLAAYTHLGTMLSALTAAGYVSLAAKDAVKGRWPPRDPSDPKVIIAALGQGGAMGLYGDFLFGQTDRFGNAPLETAAGPVIGRTAEMLDLVMKARDGDASAAQALNQIIRLTPFNNLWYAKPVADALLLNSAREWASPGYRRRTEQRLRKDFGQERLF